ncbi:MAG: DNA/RNA helicase, superfamily II [candidate division WS6 bacterium GW2011_GWF2_39_15]|uniref:DNA/RNA helicase, superfamily II n=1 Tax=candidate division WS6 bacterium GW2011_GWF2_39_15 TaxID=1619100 RepID=A0A0G0QVY2_9BACT|nr:MAG: DNA/RNA helicase, superfamily II [candidate division WS6 bacterium GW2011_GWF2_39_15]
MGNFGNRGYRGGFRSRNSNRTSYPSKYGNRGRGRGQYIDESLFIKHATKAVVVEEYKPTFKYEDLKIHPQLKGNILKKGFTLPTPIQDKAIPHILQGKDFVGIANTGTGKTAAFLIPLLEKVLNDRQNKVLIIAPTRELAEQTNEELYILTRELRIYSVECIGGASLYRQTDNIRRGYHFIIGTPGRLKDLLDKGILDFSQFSSVVLDEVDRMLDMGFIDDIKYLIARLPKERQSLFFSATTEPKVEQIMKMILKPDFVKISVKTGDTAENVDQDVIRVRDNGEKFAKLTDLLKTPEFKKVLIFVNTKRGVDKLARDLRGLKFRVESIHGDKRQRERQRAIDNFKYEDADMLIATDVAARGLDISGISHVINYDQPMTYDDYVHRIGRTGRADKKGVALTFVEKRY